jgi:hypothetical protein
MMTDKSVSVGLSYASAGDPNDPTMTVFFLFWRMRIVEIWVFGLDSFDRKSTFSDRKKRCTC